MGGLQPLDDLVPALGPRGAADQLSVCFPDGRPGLDVGLGRLRRFQASTPPIREPLQPGARTQTRRFGPSASVPLSVPGCFRKTPVPVSMRHSKLFPTITVTNYSVPNCVLHTMPARTKNTFGKATPFPHILYSAESEWGAFKLEGQGFHTEDTITKADTTQQSEAPADEPGRCASGSGPSRRGWQSGGCRS